MPTLHTPGEFAPEAVSATAMCFRRLLRVVCALACLVASGRAAVPSFEVDVQAVLAKAGCNSGACHGNLNGKGGFRLSLRGQDPAFDYEAITKVHGGRRIDVFDPTSSMLLRKPTLELAHQGGQRFDRESDLYKTLRDWVGAGAPAPQGAAAVAKLSVNEPRVIRFAPTSGFQLEVIAHFADGTSRDVSQLAVYEPSNLNVEVDEKGWVERVAFGESTVIVRYLQQQVPVTFAFLPPGTIFDGGIPNHEMMWIDSSSRSSASSASIQELVAVIMCSCEESLWTYWGFHQPRPKREPS